MTNQNQASMDEAQALANAIEKYIDEVEKWQANTHPQNPTWLCASLEVWIAHQKCA